MPEWDIAAPRLGGAGSGTPAHPNRCLSPEREAQPYRHRENAVLDFSRVAGVVDVRESVRVSRIDPNGLLQIFKCDAIGDSSDSQYCNPAFDKMYDDQLAAQTADERKTILAEMQNLHRAHPGAKW